MISFRVNFRATSLFYDKLLTIIHYHLLEKQDRRLPLETPSPRTAKNDIASTKTIIVENSGTTVVPMISTESVGLVTVNLIVVVVGVIDVSSNGMFCPSDMTV